jgi:hypothetical protein
LNNARWRARGLYKRHQAGSGSVGNMALANPADALSILPYTNHNQHIV